MKILLLAGLGVLCGSLHAEAEAHRYEIVPPAEAALEQAGQGDWEGARKALKGALAQDDTDAEAWSALSLLQDRLGDAAGARRSRRRLARLVEPRQQRAVEERQRRYLADLEQERMDAVGPEGEPGFTVSRQPLQDREAPKKPTKWDHRGWPTPTPRPTLTATPPPLQLPSITPPGKQEPRIHAPLR